MPLQQAEESLTFATRFAWCPQLMATAALRCLIAAAGLAMLGAVFQAQAADVKYIYDDAGRLVGVVAPSGELAQYVYDPAGNITEIKRLSSSTLSVIEFLPKSGPVGTQVTIWGNGFSTTTSQNSVFVNGVSAGVTSATANQLVISVPSGATTGPIAVTVATATATSTKSFVVTTTGACGSMVTGVSPSIGIAGSSITINGNGFGGAAADFSIVLNGTVGSVQSVTATTLGAVVPAAATSGRLLASVPPSCAFTSAGDFFVPPSPYAVSDIGTTGRLTFNGSAGAFTLAAGKKAVVVFEVDSKIPFAAGIDVSGSTFASGVALDIRGPDGKILTSGTITTASGTLGSVPLQRRGGYSILVNPVSGSAGSLTLKVGAPDLAISNPTVGTVTPNQNGTFGIPVTFTVTNAGSISAGSTAPVVPWEDHGYRSSNGVLDASSTSLGSISRSNVLAPGASYTVTQTYAASGAPQDAFTLFLKTDGTPPATSNGRLFEANESNNVTTGFSVVLPPYPDLAITSPSVGTITPNQNGSFHIPFAFTVTNVGASPAQEYWYDYGYLSSNGVLDASSTSLGYTPRNTALAAGASYTVTSAYDTSGLTPGSYSLFFKTDGTSPATNPGRLFEASESNNVTAGISVVVPTYPDLAISSPSVGTITPNQNGSFNIPVTFTVTNVGASPAQAWWVDYGYLSSNGVLDASSTSLAYTMRNDALAPGAGYTVTQTYVTSGVAPGSYTLFMKADGWGAGNSTGRLVEANESNNATSGISVVLPTYPDLTITSPSVGTITKNPNGSFNIPVTYTVTNAGVSPAQGWWLDYGYLSSNGVLDASSASLSYTQRNDALASGASYTVTQTYVTAVITPGTYTLFMKADGWGSPTSSGRLVEANESNNATSGISVTLN